MNDFKFAFRQLLKNRAFTYVSISSLAIGFAVAASMLAVVNAYLLRSMPYPTAKQLYHLTYAPPGPYEPGGMSAMDWNSLKEVVEDAITSAGGSYYVTDGGHPQMLNGLRVSPGFIRGLGINAAVGRTIGEEDIRSGEPVAMIGDEVWRTRFASDPNIAGREFQVHREDGETEVLRIVGVLPPDFWFGRNRDSAVDILTPLRAQTRTYMVRLREGISPASAEKRITEAARSVGNDFRPDWTGVHLESMHDRYVSEIRPVLNGITIAVGVLLLLVCSNVAILVLLRALRRQKEIAVCVALGAEHKHIARMLLAEALLICGVALAGGLALTAVALRAAAPLIETELGKPAPGGTAAIGIDSTVFLAIGAVGVLIALSLSIIPLLGPWQRRFVEALRCQEVIKTDSPMMGSLRSGLIVFEIAGSLVLLVACGLMIRSTINLVHTDLGFETKNVLRVGVRVPARTYTEPAMLLQFYTRLMEAIPPDAESSKSLAGAYPLFYEFQKQPFQADAGVGEMQVGVLRVGAGFFSVLDVALKQGHEFTDADRLGSEPVAIVSETLARRVWPDGNALGRRIRTGEPDVNDSPLGEWRTVVGVVGDMRQGYGDTDVNDVFLPWLQKPTRFARMYVRTNRPPEVWLEQVRKSALEIEPYAQVDAVNTLASEDRQRMGTRFLTVLLAGFSGFAVLLALLGIYGVTTYAAQQREREIAIRTAVGADRPAIVRMFLMEGGRLLIGGVVLGLMGTAAAVRILENQIFGIRLFDMPTIFGTSVLLIGACLLAVWLPARRAAIQNPMTVLKEG